MPLPQVDRPGTIEQIVTALQAVLKFLAPFYAQRAWQKLPFFSDWQDVAATVEGARFTVDPLGRVEIEGAARTILGTANTIAVLPIALRPRKARTFSVGVFNGSRTNGTVDVGSDGTIRIVTPAVAANIEVYLDGIRFDTRV